MTRQEEINNASNELFSSFRCSKSYKMGFEAGVMWADANPKPLWISVKDDLPCNHEDYILDADSVMPKTRKVLAYNKKGNVKETFMINVGGKKRMGMGFVSRYYSFVLDVYSRIAKIK